LEAAGFYNRTAAQVKQDMKRAGLRCVGAHYSFAQLRDPGNLDRIIAYIHELGASYIVCPGPGHKDPSDHSEHFKLSEWQWNAEQLNKLGEKVHAAGLTFGYHNHSVEFIKVGGVVPYTELLRLTDPSKVTMEMDCGWVVVGGANPVELLRKYPTRITMLHVKDFKEIHPSNNPDYEPPSAELGRGAIDYAPIFAEAAKGGHLRHAFVEQEEYDMPVFEALKIDAEYMKKFNA
jgi:sugar phosphate isomerase/epimerase